MLLEHLPPTPVATSAPSTPPEMNSAPHFDVFAAPHTEIPCPALSDAYDGNWAVDECFLQSCITYIQLSSEAFAFDALKIAWVFLYMKLGHASMYALQKDAQTIALLLGYKVACDQWQLMKLKFAHPLPPAHALFTTLPPPGNSMEVDASHQHASTPLLCCCCKKPGHFACYCLQGLEVCYLSSSEQEELLLQLLAVKDASGDPSPDASLVDLSSEVGSAALSTKQEEDF
ncbi:hypothetical protein C0995_010775 [Termitomyces sp. Mi166|nr:hypothetical protein C0995_010775 [Termitomyces sp. Mi166\